MSFETIIERRLECLSPDGNCRMIQLRIGRPYPDPKGDWSCPVAVEGWHGELGPIHGIDSWQALLLALRLLEELLSAEVERGAVLHWPPEEGQAIGIAELFSRAGSRENAEGCGGGEKVDEV